MDKNTFGNAEELKMLNYLTEAISELPKNQKEYLSNFIMKFNSRIKQIETIEVVDFRNYVQYLVKVDYLKNVDALPNTYDTDIISYLKNFINAKTNNLR